MRRHPKILVCTFSRQALCTEIFTLLFRNIRASNTHRTLDSPGFKADLHVTALWVQLLFSHIITSFSVCSCAGLFFIPFLNTVILLLLPMGSALSSSNIGSIREGRSFQQLLPDTTAVCSLPHQNVATQTQHTSTNTF